MSKDSKNRCDGETKEQKAERLRKEAIKLSKEQAEKNPRGTVNE